MRASHLRARFGARFFELFSETFFGDAEDCAHFLREQRYAELFDHPAQLLEFGTRAGVRGFCLQRAPGLGEGCYARSERGVAVYVAGDSVDSAAEGFEVARKVREPFAWGGFDEVWR